MVVFVSVKFICSVLNIRGINVLQCIRFRIFVKNRTIQLLGILANLHLLTETQCLETMILYLSLINLCFS